MANDQEPSGRIVGEVDDSMAGFRVRAAREEESFALAILASERQAEWRVYNPDPSVLSERVETTIRYRGADYRIVSEEPLASGWKYGLLPWTEGEFLQHVVYLDAEALFYERAERHYDKTLERRSHASAKYEILLGWLPSAVQENLSLAMHFSPADASRKNGFLEFLMGMSVISFSIASMSTPGMALGLTMIMEGAFRWLFGMANEGACGLLALEIPFCLARLLWSLARRKR